jgi:polyisoprenyl-teichoic acid--peptidoglycan teichoic acid transferase
MTQRRRRQSSKQPIPRSRKRERASVYPLPHARRARAASGPHAARPRSLPLVTATGSMARPGPDGEHILPAPTAASVRSGRAGALPPGTKAVAWGILVLFPLAVAVWAATIIVPIFIEARQAAGEIFVTPVPRAHFATPAAGGPLVPDSTPTPIPADATAMPSPTATVIVQIPTPEPGAPTSTPVPTATPFPTWNGTTPIHILLLGVDRRVGDSPDVAVRSDTMIVVRIDPAQKRVDMVSIPRDLLVEIPGFYATKINAAYPLGEAASDVAGGGPTLAAQTVEYNFGIWIDFFAEVDIAGMERIVDIIGGIVIDVPRIVKDDQYPTEDYGYTRVYFTPGLQRMDGVTAVRYSRTRHDDGDFARQDRQHDVLRAIRTQAEATGIITRLPEMIAEAGDSVRTDLSIRQALSLAQLGQSISEDDVHSHSLLPYMSEAWLDEGFFLIGDWVGIRTLFSDLPSDPHATNDVDAETTPTVTP